LLIRLELQLPIRQKQKVSQRQHDYNTDVDRSRDARLGLNNSNRDNIIRNKDINSSRDGCNSRDAHSKEVSKGKDTMQYAKYRTTALSATA
jgi:hypothetical protein